MSGKDFTQDLKSVVEVTQGLSIVIVDCDGFSKPVDYRTKRGRAGCQTQLDWLWIVAGARAPE
jgi:hypothetical protein